MSAPERVVVDCDQGRRMGCSSFCCRLIVRVDPDERESHAGGVWKNCIDKRSDGYCVHFDVASSRCLIWDRVPRVCREYDCNQDPLLQVVLRDGFRSLVQLVTARVDPAAPRRTIPHRALDRRSQ